MKYDGYYLAFFVFIGLIVIIYYYNIQQQQELSVNKINNVNNNANSINNINTSKPNIININNHHNKIYNELGKYKKTNNINYTYDIDNVDFHKDIISGDDNKLGNKNHSDFDPELDEVYSANLTGNDITSDNNEMFDYSIKPNKTDLPIINPPLQLLKTDAPLRLSER
jgi:hypothetical protein|uniref:Uncharacterized protein n=1 Tax=viral metagenome TaxID=1070528 RepID=A0A6C0LX50_9ZZZZ